MAKKNIAETPAKSPRFARLRQIGQAYSMTAKVDKFVGLITFAFFMLGWGAVVAVGIIVDAVGILGMRCAIGVSNLIPESDLSLI